MTNEYFMKLYEPLNEDDWYIIQTNKGFYSIRIGGINVERKINIHRYKLFYEDIEAKIKLAVTDGEWSYIILSNGKVLCFGFNYADEEGISFGVEIRNLEDFDDSFFAEDFFNSM
ncbi:hypothetical protein [Chryseobacterium takakiae]|jgi:hypothetical protein|uniref:Uncharacterized protein n=1 Tax=Chryseobacterium takakiae TaxID=1302685 RepID=A0A1M4UHF7_9FLAO|nr:hypothetical protein [Chryseobacterium takakiae]SHE56094.1 hypothetical protein SAMN05444408_102107 [Chryseobacterium takakiae]